MNITPSGIALSSLTGILILPLLVETFIISPGVILFLKTSLGESETVASGSKAFRLLAFLVIAPVCQCSNCLPVVKIKGNDESGISLGLVTLANTNLPLPSEVGKPSPKTISSPFEFGELQG